MEAQRLERKDLRWDGSATAGVTVMIRLLLLNLAYRLRDWWRKPSKQDVPLWTLRQIARTDDHRDDLFHERRPLW